MVRKNLKLQVLVNYNEMPKSSITEEDFVARRKLLRRGDIISELVSKSCAFHGAIY